MAGETEIGVPVAVPRPLFSTLLCGNPSPMWLAESFVTQACGELTLPSTTDDHIKFSMILIIRAQFPLSLSPNQLS